VPQLLDGDSLGRLPLRRRGVPEMPVIYPLPGQVLSPSFREAHLEIGRAATHIEQLTGQPAERIMALLDIWSVPVRAVGSSSTPVSCHRRSNLSTRVVATREPSSDQKGRLPTTAPEFT